MRRRRRIDVLAPATADGFAVEAWFRDSYVDAAGTEGALHEYTVRAGFAGAGDDCRVTAMEAASHVLPHPECPWATEHVGDLVGQPGGRAADGRHPDAERHPLLHPPERPAALVGGRPLPGRAAPDRLRTADAAQRANAVR